MAPRKKVQDGNEFIFCNGKKASTIASLKKEIKMLSEQEFLFHVNQEKNDFHKWIADCIDPMFAENLVGITDKAKILSALKW